MKTFIKVTVLLVIATVISGFGYEHYQKNKPTYETIVYHECLHRGDSIDGIAQQYYNHVMEDRTWEEFRYDVMERNKIHFANGRIPQPGDIVCIECHQKVKQEKK